MKKYRIKNWSQYNKSLIQRGSINLWISDDVISKWKSDKHTCKKGRPEVYSDEAILCALIVRTVYHLPLRALQGFLFSMIVLLLPDLPIPSYSQICRRAKNLGRDIEKLSQKRPKDIVFDSTGLKVYGKGNIGVRVNTFQMEISHLKERTIEALTVATDNLGRTKIAISLFFLSVLGLIQGHYLGEELGNAIGGEKGRAIGGVIAITLVALAALEILEYKLPSLERR